MSCYFYVLPNSGTGEIYNAAWVVFNEKPGSSAKANRRLRDYDVYCKIVDWDTKYIPASEKAAYKVKVCAMSS
ncbi:MAG: hypothetical protein LBD78_02005 [Spirochaetaceae bacterium]|jgi:hypothetical protein|nr:hypothetical protein [Spirochaetaceae bacterium]